MLSITFKFIDTKGFRKLKSIIIYKFEDTNDSSNRNIMYFSNIMKACKESDLILLGVNHKEFKYLDFINLGNVMKNKHILDTRNFLSNNIELLNEFQYYLLGNVDI